MTPEDAAWSAGLFEGEGHVLREGYGLVVRMTDRDVLERMERVCGGRLALRPQPGAKAHHKDVWTWKITGVKNVWALAQVWWPYLGERRRAALARQLSAWAIARTKGFRWMVDKRYVNPSAEARLT